MLPTFLNFSIFVTRRSFLVKLKTFILVLVKLHDVVEFTLSQVTDFWLANILENGQLHRSSSSIPSRFLEQLTGLKPLNGCFCVSFAFVLKFETKKTYSKFPNLNNYRMKKPLLLNLFVTTLNNTVWRFQKKWFNIHRNI